MTNKHDPQRMPFMASVAGQFLEAARRSAEFIPVEGQPNTFKMPGWPVIICRALSAEINLKALIYYVEGKEQTGHDLSNLFSLLTPMFREIMIKESGLAEEQFLARLASIKDVFVEQRYPYEDSANGSVDWGFLDGFSISLDRLTQAFSKP